MAKKKKTTTVKAKTTATGRQRMKDLTVKDAKSFKGGRVFKVSY